MDRALRLVAIVGLAGVLAAGCGAPPPSATEVPDGTAGADGTMAAGPSASPVAGAPTVDPNAPAYALRDPWAPARLPGTVHDVQLNVIERFLTVASGVVQAVWSIDGAVPGPVIRVGAGDTLRIQLLNRPPKGSYPAAHPSVNAYPHALQFDGSTDAASVPMAPVQPGDEGTLEFRAPSPGVWLYRGSPGSALENIAYGMYGMLIVEPKGGLEPVDRELFLVQGEWYVSEAHLPLPPLPSLAKASAPDPVPDYVVFNGVAGQYLDHPIEVRAGARVRVFVLDAGPNLDSSLSVDGAVLDRVVAGGVDRTVGSTGGPGAVAVRLPPGQGAIVELTLPQAGLYSIASRAGAAATLRAVEGTPSN